MVIGIRWLRWATVLPGIAIAGALAIAGARLHPPAADVAIRCWTAVAVLLFARLLAWVIQSGHTFGREERLLTFVAFSTIVLAWIGLRERVAEAAFDYRVSAQRAQLAVAARTLSYQITGFLEFRHREAPPAPRPATWDRDVEAFALFESETNRMYERRFGAQVRVAHDMLTLRGVRNRDFDNFYRGPANDFQIRVVAEKLAFLATKVDQQKP
ncbi:MAG TPA: hypothetical protein VNZ26_02465 [Vicinamibacterales bacterium]|jgi:hypothetical protein|nr:hypothetical protein [Vicinamibacterales bacterium]